MSEEEITMIALTERPIHPSSLDLEATYFMDILWVLMESMEV